MQQFMGGKPCIRGMRVTVGMIVEGYCAALLPSAIHRSQPPAFSSNGS
jgi:uncharacterized protein (DUF433 family)